MKCGTTLYDIFNSGLGHYPTPAEHCRFCFHLCRCQNLFCCAWITTLIDAHFSCNQIYLVLMKPSGRYWTWFYLVVCWFTFTLQKNATVHISIFVWLTRVEIGWRPWFPDWKLRFLFGWQFGVLHFQKSSSISHSLVGGLEHEFYFSIYWEEYSQLTNIFSEG